VAPWKARFLGKIRGIIFILTPLNYSVLTFRIEIRGLPGARLFFSEGIAFVYGIGLRS
jgi:hypothetical protein